MITKSSNTPTVTITEPEEPAPALKYKQPQSLGKTTIFKMTKMDVIWSILGLTVGGFAVYMFSKVNAVHKV